MVGLSPEHCAVVDGAPDGRPKLVGFIGRESLGNTTGEEPQAFRRLVGSVRRKLWTHHQWLQTGFAESAIEARVAAAEVGCPCAFKSAC